MKKTIFLLFLFLIFSNYKLLKKPPAGERFVYKLQFYKIIDKRLITQEDSTNIYYRGNTIIYEKPYHYLTKSGLTTKDTLAKELKARYLISDRAGSFGIWFDSLTEKVYRRVNVDSFKNNDFLVKLGLHNLKHYVLASSEPGNTPGSFVEKYAVKDKPDDSYFDTTCFYFSRKSNLRYAMDAEFEKIKKAKLYKEVLIYNPAWNAVIHDTVPRREFILELKEIPESKRVQEVMDKYLAIKNQ